MSAHLAPGAWDHALRSVGFVALGNRTAYACGEIRCQINAHWARLCTSPSVPEARDGAGDFDRPGLWKTITAAGGSKAICVFDLPLETAPGYCESELLRSLLQWALTTADGAVPRDWTSPGPANLGELTGRENLTVRCGSILRQVTWLNAARLGLRCTIVDPISPELGHARIAWLDQLLAAAHRRWRLVRVGRQHSSTAVAEVDLTGVPPLAAEPLLPIALQAMQCAVAWLAEPAHYIVEPQENCRALALCPPPMFEGDF